MLTIRLKRIGKRNKAYYQLVVAQKERAVSGKFIEILGSVDPHAKKKTVNKERTLYWLNVGAQPSDTAYNLLCDEKIITSPKMKLRFKKKKKESDGSEKALTEKANPEAPKTEGNPKTDEAPAPAADTAADKKEAAPSKKELKAEQKKETPKETPREEKPADKQAEAKA